MKRLVAVICLAFILVCAGNALPCFAAGARAAQASCCDDQPAAPEPTCPCCPQLRPVVLVMIHPLAVPTEYHAPVKWSVDDQHEPPDPREILHVPKLAPSLG